jgi:hypothetical protein
MIHLYVRYTMHDLLRGACASCNGSRARALGCKSTPPRPLKRGIPLLLPHMMCGKQCTTVWLCPPWGCTSHRAGSPPRRPWQRVLCSSHGSAGCWADAQSSARTQEQPCRRSQTEPEQHDAAWHSTASWISASTYQSGLDSSHPHV